MVIGSSISLKYKFLDVNYTHLVVKGLGNYPIGSKLKKQYMTICINKLSRGKMCAANFIPPANVANLGNKLLF
jgi:hypothetical protein